MANIHFITTVLVGGRTGKSTVCMMLAAHLCRPGTEPNNVVVVDMSIGQLLYKQLHRLFGAPTVIPFANHHGFVCDANAGAYQSRLIVAKPDEYLESDAMVNYFKVVRDEAPKKFGGQPPDHYIIESNLPRDIVVSKGGFLDDLRGGPKVRMPLYLWTTWITDVMGQKEDYNTYQLLTANQGDRIRIFYVHNPFANSGGVGCPEGPLSPVMEQCFHLPASEADYTPEQMWTRCGLLARKTTSDMPGEDQWVLIYDKFLTAERPHKQERPRNLLSVYRESKNWKKFQHDLSFGPVSSPVVPIHYAGELFKQLDFASQRMCSVIFSNYFSSIGLD